MQTFKAKLIPEMNNFNEHKSFLGQSSCLCLKIDMLSVRDLYYILPFLKRFPINYAFLWGHIGVKTIDCRKTPGFRYFPFSHPSWTGYWALNVIAANKNAEDQTCLLPPPAWLGIFVIRSIKKKKKELTGHYCCPSCPTDSCSSSTGSWIFDGLFWTLVFMCGFWSRKR